MHIGYTRPPVTAPVSRLIHLRRPPTIARVDEPFLPAGVDLGEVERRWDRLREANPAHFDGRILHVLRVARNGCGGAAVHVVECAYRFYAVQTGDFDLGVRPLGVKGLTRRDGRVLVGRRGPRVSRYAGRWEFAPGGGVEPGRSPARALVDELRSETGLRPAREPVAVAIFFDPEAATWEIVHEVLPAADPLAPKTDEYDELRWCAPEDLPEPLSPAARIMRPLVDSPARRG